MGKNTNESVFLENVQPFAATFSASDSFQNTRVSAAALHRLSLKKTTRVVDTIGNIQLPVANGTLANIRQYSKCLFGDDEDQRQTFECLTASFVLKLYQRARAEETSLESTKKRFLNTEKNVLEKVNRGAQLICFLSGPGGTGKSFVITSYVRYCSEVCSNLRIKFDSKTIVVSAITGAAAVSIRGQTTASALCLKRHIIEDDVKQWENTYAVVADEISFSKKSEIESANHKCRELKEEQSLKFGGVDIVFAGDFTQLRPVRAKPIYLEDDFVIWDDWIHTFFELRTNHRFKNDVRWGNILSRFRDLGPSVADVNLINTRVIGSDDGPGSHEIPKNVTYATKTNVDRMAINDGIFFNHMKDTHSKDPHVVPPVHTLCIKAGNLNWRKNPRELTRFNKNTEDIFYACVGEAHVKSVDESKTYDPLLKLYKNRPVMINDNIDVTNCEANGTMCEFEGVIFKTGVTIESLEKIVIDGYHVWCAHVSQLESISIAELYVPSICNI
ncbi:PIF1-like helicase [Nitzschia inconspicua]|uniref:ATP-dependent DNA helicase n=1 Tax=Nitzschia inconspicua TaxID=303405 RepID=A0A9K3Q5G3_9STRA|nr:PIF1-like helicase [Nitzschia inconspicua]